MSDLSPVVKRAKRPLQSTEKQIIYNLFKSFQESDYNSSHNEIAKTIASSTGIHVSTVYKVIQELKSGEPSKSPKKKRNRLSISNKFDGFTKSALRNVVHKFYFENEMPKLDKILNIVKEDPDFPSMSRSTLYKALKKLGFSYNKRGRNSILVERPDIVLWRRKYLDEIKAARQNGTTIYYLDETWLNAGHTKSKVWVDNTVTTSRSAFLDGLSTGLKNPSGKGKRLIIVHIGSVNGFVEGGLKYFESKKTGDYHQDMDATVFENWFQDILPKLDENAVIVLDNASYHSRKLEKSPTTSSRKQDIIEWLQSKHITCNKSMLKLQLLDLVKQNKDRFEKFVIDEMAKSTNRRVIRLPPYHCELNPIELVWAQVKGYVAANNKSYKINEVRTLLLQGLAKVDRQKWSSCVNHVITKIETKMYGVDNQVENMLEQFIIDVSAESSLEGSDDDSF